LGTHYVQADSVDSCHLLEVASVQLVGCGVLDDASDVGYELVAGSTAGLLLAACSTSEPPEQISVGRGQALDLLTTIAAAQRDRHGPLCLRHDPPGRTETLPTLKDLDRSRLIRASTRLG